MYEDRLFLAVPGFIQIWSSCLTPCIIYSMNLSFCWTFLHYDWRIISANFGSFCNWLLFCNIFLWGVCVLGLSSQCSFFDMSHHFILVVSISYYTPFDESMSFSAFVIDEGQLQLGIFFTCSFLFRFWKNFEYAFLPQHCH